MAKHKPGPRARMGDVKLNWQRVSEIAQTMLNVGVETAKEIKAAESELLMAANCVVLNIIEQGLGTQEKLVVTRLLGAQWRAFIAEHKAGLIELEYEVKEDKPEETLQ